jgi:succinate-acetate transporter protein
MAQNEHDKEISLPAAANAPVTANPAPLGLCAFALTTFVLSAANAKLFTGAEIVIGLALFYGGLAQLLAGMWEFKTGNTFGATAFSSYGAFWLAVGASLQLNHIPNETAFGFFLLGWTIFTGMMLLASLKTSLALITVFALLFVTFILLTVGAMGGGLIVDGKPVDGGMTQIGGYFGLATALAAWYTALAGLLSSMPSAFTLPVGPRS